MVETAGLFLIYGVYSVLLAKRILTYLHVLQQDDYSNARLRKWIFTHRAFDRRLTLGLVAVSALSPFLPDLVMMFVVFFLAVVTIYYEKDPRKSVKKKLVATDRAKRIFYPTFVLMALMGAWCFVPNSPYGFMAWPWIIIVQAVPFVLLSVNALLQPFEQSVQKLYWNEAREKMDTLSPKVIAITGSFGKTSVKHILGHILSTQAPTLMTPGSVNTAMGITRIIRERLTDDHQYFIVEMGAYGPGSIAGLCALTPPDYGVITAIGHAHYERFRSLDTVAHAKFELAEAVIEKGTGTVIIHERTLKFQHARGIRLEHGDAFVVCGEPPVLDVHEPQKGVNYLQKDDVHILKVEQGAAGLDIQFSYGEMKYNLEVPLYGLHHGHNCVLAAAAALQLGVDIGHIQIALQSLPQIPHRLEVRDSPDGRYKIIDDSFNSNPLGFRSALDLLPVLAGDDGPGRKILLTPGMIEMGIAHDEAHAQIGEYAGGICDVAIVVQPSRIPTFVAQFEKGGKTVIGVDSFQEASEWLQENVESGDVVLIENDLPDMYECIPTM